MYIYRIQIFPSTKVLLFLVLQRQITRFRSHYDYVNEANYMLIKKQLVCMAPLKN